MRVSSPFFPSFRTNYFVRDSYMTVPPWRDPAETHFAKC